MPLQTVEIGRALRTESKSRFPRAGSWSGFPETIPIVASKKTIWILEHLPKKKRFAHKLSDYTDKMPSF